MSEEKISVEVITVIVVAAIVFLATFFFFTSMPKENDVDGLKVIAVGEVGEAVKNAVKEKNKVLMRIEANASNESKLNGCIIAMSAEIIRSLAAINRTPEAFVEQEKVCYDVNQSIVECPKANVVIEKGECNCIRVGEKIEVSGRQEFLCDKEKIVKISKLIAWATSWK